MSSAWLQLILQLGISGAVLFVGYKLGLKVIASWSKAESERNVAWAKAESDRTSAIHAGFTADIEAHQAITAFVQKLAEQFARLEGKLDTILDLTPVRQQIEMPALPTMPATVIVDPALRRERAQERAGRTTPSKGVPTAYGPVKAGGK